MVKLNKNKFKQSFETKMYSLYAQSIKDATDEQLLNVLCSVIKDIISKKWVDNKLDSQKEVYYFSIEFLLGRQLKSNLLNLGIEDVVRTGLKELNIDLDSLINAESDPALGNGGLGRLAACFLDSMASLDISGHGYGIRYKHGLFEQKFINGYQVEVPDNWLTQGGYVWETVRPNKAIVVKFEGNVNLVDKNGRLEVNHTDYIPVMAMPYDIPIIGYRNNSINTLRLFKSEVLSRDFGPLTIHAKNSYGSYEDALKYKYYAEEISQVLYPNDSNYAGRLLRLKQEYFFVSAGIQDIIRKYKKNKLDIKKLNEKVAIHINDTHPTLCIPELMRILLDEEGLSWDEAWNITINTVSYTNHTIMTEAMERWPKEMLKTLLPRIYMIIEEIDRRYMNELEESKYDHDKIYRMSIIDNNDIKMANLSIVGSHSVNGVAKLHTELLKKEVLKDFYDHEPEKFNNKTNGIAHRRWLISSNTELSDLITGLISEDWKTDTRKLKELEVHRHDKAVLEKIGQIKYNNKERLAKFIKEKYDIDVNPNSIFDVQIKRLHAYKRQLLNALHILHLYHELLENPNFDMEPRTFIFGAKAAPGYYLAKCIIKFINSLAEKINNDPRIDNKIKVVFIENYDVSKAELIIPAADVSEQISTTTKEASGTGNMKLMMNGAITLATLDGANIEIFDQVGEDNIVIFGLSANEVLNYNKFGGYSALDLYNSNRVIKRVVDDLVNGFIPNMEKEGRQIYDSLITYNDEYFVLRDMENYIEAQEKIDRLYKNKEKWNEMALINIANSGVFSSDRTIAEYAEDIWFKGCE
ncbi:MAG: glycogen/starch/alpha-glucan phosphorylase [Romboutsia timonensis]|uniref:glycogen/starch/alpha-glucan phosphorylase n=1 Tax=Romboutsia timonensis TaxID=1776391 RepID=UPI002A764125|nr:glycogen/starch/alpha-glucan phosphorylase [Romboutsia timonensis]MDY2881809.1 glycogen/starch/alpha-glucan phosphorylase [Romboutsia timonensis]